MNKGASVLIIFLLIVLTFLIGAKIALISKQKAPPLAVLRKSAGVPTVSPTAVVTPTGTPVASKKNPKPEIKFFVMSFCPFGNQAEAGLAPVYQLLKDKADWSVRYIINKDSSGKLQSLHGEQELNQDIREVCVFDDLSTLGSTAPLSSSPSGKLDKWWQFVLLVNQNCTSASGDQCWQEQAKQAGLSADKLNQCFNSKSKEILEKELAETNAYNISGSPTVLINDEVYEGGRAPEDYKKAICDAFETPPAECQTTLSTESGQVGGRCGE